MATYLLLWNQDIFQWEDIQESIDEIDRYGFAYFEWRTGNNKRIQPDDRLFLMKVGSPPKGIVASGWAISQVLQTKFKESKREIANYIELNFDAILNPDHENIFPIEKLEQGVYQGKKTWTPQASGMIIESDIAEQLEKDWASFLKRPVPVKEINYADELDVQKTYQEGAPKKVTTTVYERNPLARAVCIKEYGAICAVCGFDFERKYGELGKGFIHVHHLQPRAEVGKNDKLNPKRDLRPVCPNCHAMLHQREPVYSIDELRDIIKKAAK
ncbi:MAG: HNH endonuclease [Anaerolineales bacterium]|nr:HNH endonuclease [Anaerolineales bacterium]